MITLALFLSFTLGIIILMKTPPHGFEGGGQFPAIQEDRQEASGYVEFKKALQFQDFCKKECRYRLLCMKKGAAREAGTCYEFQLCSNALW